MLDGFENISADPEVCGGRPTVAGTRMRVTDILDMLASGVSEDEILADFDYISRQDIRACLAYAARSTEHPVIASAAE